MAATAVLAVIVDVGTALLLWKMSRGSLNVRAAFVHNIVDALGSVAVLIGAAAIIWLDWVWVDAAITLLIAGYVLWQVVKMLPQATRVLMEGTPPNMDLNALVADVISHGLPHNDYDQLGRNVKRDCCSRNFLITSCR